MSAWMSPHRLSVTGVQLRMAKSATTTATSTQNNVFRNCIGAARFRRARAVVARIRSVRRKTESVHRKRPKPR